MGAKGSAFSRAIRFMREGDLDEVEFVISKGTDILEARQLEARKDQPVVRKPRRKRKQVNGVEQTESTHSTEAR